MSNSLSNEPENPKALCSSNIKYTSWDSILLSNTDIQGIQKMYKERTACLKRQRAFRRDVIPGDFQIPAYIEALFRNEMFPVSEQEIIGAVKERSARQMYLLDQTKSFEAVISETVLRSPIAKPEAMALQMERLIEISTYPNVKLGILLLDTPLSYIPYSSWNIDDDSQVEFELLGANVSLVGREDIEQYASMFDHLMERSLKGDDAREYLGRIADQYSSQIAFS